MEHKVRIISPEELMPQLPRLLEETENVPLVISGNSMAPFLRHGRDVVYLSKVTRPLKKGDMILYRRLNGSYILHRVCRCGPHGYDLAGDAQLHVEAGIRPEQVLAVVNAVRRKGKLLEKGNFQWEFYERVWLALLPLRPMIFRIYGAMKGWRNKK